MSVKAWPGPGVIYWVKDNLWVVKLQSYLSKY